MAEFIAENNACGQCILNLVARGNAIVAEILRLKNYIPPIFRLTTKHDQQKYRDLIIDFSYFKISEAIEKKIENDPALQDLDEELRDNYGDILNRFYLAFESVHKHIIELNQFVEDLEEGVFFQNSLESIFLNLEGCQLMSEALYLYGVMLLEIDRHIDGLIRERLLVAHYRYSAQQSSASSNIDDICKLFRSTTINSRQPPNYPEDYFRRIPINENLVSMVIGRLRSDDIYNQISAYPFPEHRVVALAPQAAMLYVCLFFDASVLHNQTAKMREIVDKYFPDNWVVNIYLGFTVNLIDSWDPFKAAKTALCNTLETSNVRQQTSHHAGKIQKLMEKTKQLLREKALTEESVLGNTTKIMNLARECNVTLRWLILHTTPPASDCCKRTKQVYDQILGDMKKAPESTLALMLNAAEFEFRLKELFKTMLAEKRKNWEYHQKNSAEQLMDLSLVFSGEKSLLKVEKNANLHEWFQKMAKEIETLNVDEISVSSRKMVQIVQALDEVKEFHQLSSNMQICQNLKEAKESLTSMIRSEGMKESLLITLQIVSDFSYAWQLVDAYTPYMQEQIKENPAIVVKLKAIFLKLSTALETVVLRINQAGSDDLISVSQYYSQELVSYMRRVLQIIPQTMFSLMTRIIGLQTNVIEELPTRLEKEKLREYAKIDSRFEVANLTHSIAVFSEGILSMQSTSLGVVQIDPPQLLEEGIRKELVHNIAHALHTGIIFSPKSKAEELIKKLEALGDIMDGYRRSFEYIQDYIGMFGLKIWQEELSRVISYNVEQETNSFIRNKVAEWQSVHQSKAVPIPSFPPTDSVSVTFIGRLASQLIHITDPKTNYLMAKFNCWYDHQTADKTYQYFSFSLKLRSLLVCLVLLALTNSLAL
ncbi:unnamed protein product [Bemisia tabaci]|uniref:WASH complex subunit strumpellin n=1 Tax=Bemisia tabaci TaxID=7038 RepID=A0A9P0A0H4_BEMTA|nr:unnamed protein product [Bemisia tabaci]